jgi:transposase-like protein
MKGIKLMNNQSNKLFWSATIEELRNGFIENDQEYKCIICEAVFQEGRIYEINSELYDARKAVELHIKTNHDSMLGYLLGMNSAFTGLSDVQREVLTLISYGLSDKEVATKLGVAQSTIRNHRYKLRQKEKQAKVFIALMELLSKNTNEGISKLEKEVICDSHKTATTLDDRYNITDKEKEKTIKIYMNDEGALKSYPSKAKKKIIILEEIVKNFSKGKTYSEKEINRILKRIYNDYPAIRRALIEYGFIERTNDCTSYWVKE